MKRGASHKFHCAAPRFIVWSLYICIVVAAIHHSNSSVTKLAVLQHEIFDSI